MFDAIIVGGSYAGQSAALQLARARRNILVIDEGQRRNRFASHSHGFLGQDGRDPAAIAEDAREQLLAYPNVTWLADRAAGAEPTENGFAVTCNDGRSPKVKVGASFTCRVTVDGADRTVTVTIEDRDGTYGVSAPR